MNGEINMINNPKIQNIKDKIKEIERDFQRINGLILTEDDLKCLIFNKLYDSFSTPQNTADDQYQSIPIHAEIKWFNKEKKLRFKPDITILKPKFLTISKSLEYLYTGEKVPISGKRCEFSAKDSIIMEIKFFKNPNGITKTNKKLIEKDVQKVKKLFSLQTTQMHCIIVVFSKTNKNRQKFDEIITENSEFHNLHFIYGTANFKQEV